jgi:hypothetical protein
MINNSNNTNSPTTYVTENERRLALTALATELIHELTSIAPDITEGTVMTTGPIPYRRLDCDRRALAYIRTRPRKGMVRVDVSGLWLMPARSRLREDSSGSGASLILRSAADKDEAISFLLEAIEITRTRLARERAAEEQRRARLAELRGTLRGPRKKYPRRDDGALLAADAAAPPGSR